MQQTISDSSDSDDCFSGPLTIREIKKHLSFKPEKISTRHSTLGFHHEISVDSLIDSPPKVSQFTAHDAKTSDTASYYTAEDITVISSDDEPEEHYEEENIVNVKEKSYDFDEDSLNLDDTLEDMNRFLKYGADYISNADREESGVKELNCDISQPETVHLLPEQQGKPCEIRVDVKETPAKDQMTKGALKKIPSEFDARVPLSNYNNVPPKPMFKTPNIVPKSTKKKFGNIMSPVACYIKSTTPVLSRNAKSSFKDSLPTYYKNGTKEEEEKMKYKIDYQLNFVLPYRIYKPGTEIYCKEKEIILPKNIKKLLPDSVHLENHESKATNVSDSYFENRLQNDDLTLADLTIRERSILTSRKMFIE